MDFMMRLRRQYEKTWQECLAHVQKCKVGALPLPAWIPRFPSSHAPDLPWPLGIPPPGPLFPSASHLSLKVKPSLTSSRKTSLIHSLITSAFSLDHLYHLRHLALLIQGRSDGGGGGYFQGFTFVS